VREVIAATLFAATLAACSDIYYDRRETIALGADDAVASNKAIHIIDPWPRHSGNRRIAFNGERMQKAVECYRQNDVTEPINPTTSSVQYQQTQKTASRCTKATVNQQAAPAASVKKPD
jgi:hypothetical protein